MMSAMVSDNIYAKFCLSNLKMILSALTLSSTVLDVSYGNQIYYRLMEPAHEIMVLIAQANSEGSGEAAYPRNLARAFAVRTHKVWK